MIPFLKTFRREGLASPYGPVLLACAVFLWGWLFPPDLYSHVLREHDFIFLDTFSFVFFFVCVAAFLLGIRACRVFSPASWKRPSSIGRTASPILYICVPLIVGCMACAMTLVEYGAHINFIMLLASQQGDLIKEVAGGVGLVQGFWSKAPIFLTGAIWWSQLRLQQVGLDQNAKRSLFVLWLFAFSLDAFACIVLVDRTALMPLITGCGLISLYWRHASGRLKLGGAVFYGFASGLIAVAFFVLIAFFRGNVAADLLVNNFLGYTIASYNRFAALLHGQMRFFYAGRGLYLFAYLRTAFFIDPYINIQNLLNWPVDRALYHSEFSSMALAGLNTRYIWAGVFGYLYSDLGWGAPVYVFFCGIMTGAFWMKLKAGSAVAVVMYPWVASWVLLWQSWNLLFNDDFVHLLPIAFLLAVWDRLFLIKRTVPNPITTFEVGALAP